MACHWPGNVRELENGTERAVLVCAGDSSEAQHPPPTLQMPGDSARETRGTLESALPGLERELICTELEATRGNMTRAARNLGITERVMGLRVSDHRIETRRFRRRTARNHTPAASGTSASGTPVAGRKRVMVDAVTDAETKLPRPEVNKNHPQ